VVREAWTDIGDIGAGRRSDLIRTAFDRTEGGKTMAADETYDLGGLEPGQGILERAAPPVMHITKCGRRSVSDGHAVGHTGQGRPGWGLCGWSQRGGGGSPSRRTISAVLSRVREYSNGQHHLLCTLQSVGGTV
jgi:hypothetical protein